MINNKYILFYDSGMGGLSTLRAAMRLERDERFLYFADDKNCPYGEKSKEDIKRLVIENLNAFLARFEIKMVVFACNTITTCCIDELRKKFDICFVGTEPAVRLAKREFGGEILLCATRATINEERLKKLVKSVGGGVFCLPLDGFAAKIESGEECIDCEKEKILQAKKGHEFSCMVLGCTHYCLLKSQLEKASGLRCVDGNDGVARRISKLLGGLGRGDSGKVEIILSSGDSAKRDKYYKILESI